MSLFQATAARIGCLVGLILLTGCVSNPSAPAAPVPDDEIDIARSIGVFREKTEKGELLRHVHVFRGLKKNVISQKIYVEFQGSPRMTEYIRQRLTAAGYSVVGTQKEANNSFVLKGAYGLQVAGRRLVYEDLAPVIEQKAPTADSNKSPEAHPETVSLGQIAAVTHASKALDTTGIAIWLIEQTGFSVAMDKLMFGVPDGSCDGGRCPGYNNTVMINVWGDNGRFVLEESMHADKVILDKLIPDAIEHALSPLLDGQRGRTEIAK